VLAASQPVRDNRSMPPGESTIEMLLRIITGVVAACAAIATLLSAIWVTTDPQSTGSWLPVLPWAIIAAVSVACFGVLLVRARARHARR
jgi:hypothetical protein